MFIKIDYSSCSKIGNRDINEDSVICLQDKNKYLFVIADGLGGYDDGEIASSFVTEYISDQFNNHNISDHEWFKFFTDAHSLLLDRQKETLSSGLKTTLSALYINKSTIKRAFVGDSRIYRFEKNKQFERSSDHSSAQQLLLSGDISDEEIRFNPERNKLLKAIGDTRFDGTPEIMPDLKLKKGDAYLLCTDGFWEYITEEQMMTCLAGAYNSVDWIKLMTDIVKSNGQNSKMDNYSAIGVLIK